MYEDSPSTLLKGWLTRAFSSRSTSPSNEDTLGIAGKNHPFPIYRAFGVPVALSTDEEGIERIELTHEYVQAVQSYSLIYPDLKENRPQQRRIWPLAGRKLTQA
jgi:adenosine deaminase